MLPMKKAWKYALVASISLLGLICFAWTAFRPYCIPVLKIADQPVFADEWRSFLQQQKSAATVYYTKNYGCTTFDEQYWRTEYDGRTPLDYARKLALDALIDDCMILQEARDKSLIDAIDLRTLKKEWQAFNEQRQSAAENGVIYGPLQYSFENYYRHLISNLRNSLGELLTTNTPFTETELQGFYQKNRAMFTNAGDMQAVGLRIEGDEVAAYDLMLQAKQDISNGMSFEEACARYAASGEPEPFEFTFLNEKATMHGQSEIYTACSSTGEGELSDIVQTQQGCYLFLITQKNKEQVLNYEEVKNRIRDILAAEKLEVHLKTLRDSCKIQIQEQLWEKIQME